MVPIRRGHVDYGLSVRTAGDIDEDVDTLPSVERRLDHIGDRLFVGDIGDERYRIGAFSGELSCSALGCFGVDIDNRQLRAFASEALSNRAADAATAAGDDHDPAVDSSHCRLYLSDK